MVGLGVHGWAVGLGVHGGAVELMPVVVPWGCGAVVGVWG